MKRLDEGDESDEVFDRVDVNGGNGFGWSIAEVECEVNDHLLVIGVTTDVLRTGVAFTGHWLSFVDWSLTLIEKYDNSGWYGPMTNIEDIHSSDSNVVIKNNFVYDITGRRVNKSDNLPAGIYILNGKKILVR